MENDMEKLSREEMSQILKTSHTVAVVGLSSKPNRPGYSIPAYLQEQGYRIIPVNPTINEALGEKAYASLHEIPESVDIVQVFRRSEEVPPVVEDAIAIGAKVVWMQAGIVNEQAAARAREAGLQVVMDTCMGATHRALRARGDI
jgi:uncharacterized protein